MEDKKSLNELSKLSKLTERMVDLLESDVSTRRADKAQERKDKIQMSRSPSNRSESETRHDKDMLSYTRNSSEANAVTSRQEITRHKESELSNKSIFTTLKALLLTSVAQGAATLQSTSLQQQAKESMSVAAKDRAATAKDRKTTDRRDSKMFHGMLHMAEQNYVTSNQIATEIVKLHSAIRRDGPRELKARLEIMKSDRHEDLKREQRLNNMFEDVIKSVDANIHTQGKLQKQVDLGDEKALLAKAMMKLGDNLDAFDRYTEILDGTNPKDLKKENRAEVLAEIVILDKKFGKEFELIKRNSGVPLVGKSVGLKRDKDGNPLLDKDGKSRNLDPKEFLMDMLKNWGMRDGDKMEGKRSSGVGETASATKSANADIIETLAGYKAGKAASQAARDFGPMTEEETDKIRQSVQSAFTLEKEFLSGMSGSGSGGMGDCCDTLKDIYNEIVKHSDILQQSVVGKKSPLGQMVGRLVHGGGEKFSGSTEGGTGFTGKTKGSSYTRKEFGELKGNPELLASMFDEETAKAILDGKVTFNETSGILRIKTETGPIDTTDSVANELAKKELKISTKSEARDVKRARREEEIRRDSKTSRTSGGVTPFGGSFGRNAEDGGDSWYEDLDLTDAGVGLLVANQGYEAIKNRKKNKNKNKKPKAKNWRMRLLYGILGAEVVNSIFFGDDEDSGTVNADTGEVFDEGTLGNAAINAAWTGLSVYEGYQLGSKGVNRFKNRVSSPNFVGPRQPPVKKNPSWLKKKFKGYLKKLKPAELKKYFELVKDGRNVMKLKSALAIGGGPWGMVAAAVLFIAEELVFGVVFEAIEEVMSEQEGKANSMSFDSEPKEKDNSAQGALNRLGMEMLPAHYNAQNAQNASVWGKGTGPSYSQNYSGTLIAGMPVGNKLTKVQYEMMKLDKSMGNTHSGSLNDKFNAFKLSEADLTRIETPNVGLASDAMKALVHADDGPNNSLGVNIHNWEDSPFGGTRNSILDAVDKTGLWGWVKDGIKTDVNDGFDGLGSNPTKAQVEALWKGKSSNLSNFGGETESSIKSIYATEFKKFFGTVLGGIGSVLWGSNAMAGNNNGGPWDHGYGDDPDGAGFWKPRGKKTPMSDSDRKDANRGRDNTKKWMRDREIAKKRGDPEPPMPEIGKDYEPVYGEDGKPSKMNQANRFAAQMVNLSTRYSPKGQMFPLTMMNHGTNSAAQIKANGFQSRFANAGWAGKNMFYGSPGLNVAGAYGGQNIPVVANAGSRRIFGGGIGANGMQFGDEIAMGARGMNQGMDLASRLANHPNSAMAQRLLKTGTTSQASKLLKFGGRAFPGIGAGLAAWDAKARYDKGDMLGSSLSAGSGIPIAGLIPLAVQLVTDYLGITGGDNSSSVMNNYVPTKNLNPVNEGKLINGGGNTIINNTTNTTSNNSATDVIFSTNAHAPALPPGMVGYGS